MEYELLVLDLDGTLTTSEKTISPKTKDAIMKLQESGKKVVLASGRPTPGVAPLAEELNLEKYGSYILSYNGGRIIDCATKELVFNEYIDPKYLADLYEIAKANNVDISTYNNNVVYIAFELNDEIRKECKVCHLTPKKLDNFVDEIDFPMNKVMISGNPDILEGLEIQLQEQFRGKLNVYRSEPYFLEVMPPKIDKAYGLSKLLEILNLTTDQMICCGDGYNDITMIEFAGLGVAMANAQQAVLDIADFVTLSNDNDGIAHVIDTFIPHMNEKNL